MSKVKIQPKNFDKSATEVEISVDGFDLHSQSGNVRVVFKDSDGKRVGGMETLAIPAEVWSTWGTDDSVIENYVLEQLGLTKA